MKIIVLHGEDTEKSYQRLKKFIETAKERSWEVSYLDESDRNIKENLSSPSLFSEERFFILRDIRRLGKSETSWLNKNYAGLSGNLIIYHEGTLNQTFLKTLPKEIKIEEFKIPVLLWNFLDNLVPGNAKKSIQTFHKIINKEAPEFIFTLIAKLFRDLYWVKVDPASMPYPSWRVSKLKTQSSKFTDLLLTEIIESLAKMDIEAKTSKSDLISELDLLILKQLE